MKKITVFFITILFVLVFVSNAIAAPPMGQAPYISFYNCNAIIITYEKELFDNSYLNHGFITLTNGQTEKSFSLWWNGYNNYNDRYATFLADMSKIPLGVGHWTLVNYELEFFDPITGEFDTIPMLYVDAGKTICGRAGLPLISNGQ